MKLALSLALLSTASALFSAQAPEVPDWAQPGSATHKQVPPPADFHRATKSTEEPIGIFTGQSDIGSAVVAGTSSYDPNTKQYTIHSAGYNIWYTRDEFRYLWKKMSGDVSLAADIVYPNPEGYGDRKAVLIIRQDLEDDSKEAMGALHGAGLIHLAQRAEKNASIKEAHRLQAGAFSGAKRLGIEKRGDEFTLYVSLKGEPLHAVGEPMKLHFDAPFYVGVGFTSHLPATSDTTVLSNVVLENSAGKVK
jgi:hypothetical protein